jgi:hypothetical protein
MELADGLVISRRTVWRLLADMKRSGLVRTRRRGKAYLYFVNPQAVIPDPVFDGLNFGEMVERVWTSVRSSENEVIGGDPPK